MIIKLILTVIFLWVIFWVILEYLSDRQLKKLKKEYKKDDDKTREGKDVRTGTKESGFRKSSESKGRQLLQTPTPSNARKTGTSVRKNRGFDKFLQNLNK